MKNSILFLASALLLTPISGAWTAPTTPTKPEVTKPEIDAGAVALMGKSASAYGAVKGLSMKFSVVTQKISQTINVTGTLDFARPGRAKITAKRGAETSLSLGEGSRVFLQVGPRRFQSAPLQGERAIEVVLEQMPSTLSMILPLLVKGENPLVKSDMTWSKVALLPDNCVALTLISEPGEALEARLYFDASDHLLRRFEAKIQTDGSRTTQITSLTNVQINPEFTLDTFLFKPGGALGKAAPR